MARPATGSVVEKATSRGKSYAIRFRAFGERQYELLGYSSEGWDRRRAEQHLAEVLADVRRGLWIPPDRRIPDAPPEVPSFHEFASEWLAARTLDGLRPRSLEYLRWALTDHLLAHFAEMRLDEITAERIDTYARGKASARKAVDERIAGLRVAMAKAEANGEDVDGLQHELRAAQRAPGLSNRSINRTIDVLAQVLEQAVEYGHIEKNPARGRRRRLAAPRPRRAFLDSAEHITALLDGARVVDRAARTQPGMRRALLATLVFAGLRIGEALDLRWSDVNLADGKLKVRVHSKTQAGLRVVDIKPVLREELASYRAGLTDLGLDTRVFGSADGRRMSESNVRNRILAPAVRHADIRLEAAGLELMPEGLTPHGLRRTFASILAAIGEPTTSVMRQMGHRDGKLTLSVYQADMARGDGERDRLRALVEAAEWAPLGTEAGSGTGETVEQLAA